MNVISGEAPSDARRRWMGILAKARPAELEAGWSALDLQVEHEWLRAPEAGMAMVKGRAGGDGAPFNLGEMTMTRCAVRLDDGTVGFGYVAGRHKRHAALSALCDALLQQPANRDRLLAELIAPLADAQSQRADDRSRRAASTKVDFFTMVRGDNPK